MTALTRRQLLQGAGVAGLGLLAACGQLPFPPRATRIPRVGYLAVGTPGRYDAAFQQGLNEFGYTPGQNVAVEYRWVQENLDQLPGLATELIQQGVEVLIASAGPAILAARQASSTIPVVMLASGDPVGNGIVASLAHPGGNITGLSWMAPTLATKRLDLLHTAVPHAARVGVVLNPTELAAASELRETQTTADTLGIQLLPMEVRQASELEGAFAAATQSGAEAFITFAHPFAMRYSRRLAELAASAQRPAMYGLREFVDEGGLMAYGPSMVGLYRRAAYYVDRILKGAQPNDLPVEQPREFEFVINVRTAQALGLTISQQVLLQATEVLQ